MLSLAGGAVKPGCLQALSHPGGNPVISCVDVLSFLSKVFLGIFLAALHKKCNRLI